MTVNCWVVMKDKLYVSGKVGVMLTKELHEAHFYIRYRAALAAADHIHGKVEPVRITKLDQTTVVRMKGLQVKGS